MVSFTFSRIYIFTFLPLVLGTFYYLLNRRDLAKADIFEQYIIFYFALGVAGSGIGNFFSHFFMSDIVAESIGWTPGSPFQLEVAFTNLAIGLLGLIAVSRKDGFREASVIAATVFAVGATIVHFMDIIETGNLSPGNSIQNIANILKPAILIFLLSGIRRLQKNGFEPNHYAGSSVIRHLSIGAGVITALSATAVALGFAFEMPALMSVIATAASLAIVAIISKRGG